MQCRICKESSGHTIMTLREMMFGTKDEFPYFECSSCGCIQIERIPENMSPYYPENYYSFSGKISLKRKSILHRLRTQYLIGGRKTIIGKWMASGYQPQPHYEYLRHLRLFDYDTSILDIGSGTGDLLKKWYKLGYRDLTGVDPYIEKDIVYNSSLRIEKKSVFDITRTYDVVMLHHSLEHMDRQEEIILQLKKILKPGGRLLIRIPVVSKKLMELYGTNVVSLDPPRHFYIHSLKSITGLLDKAGFNLEKKVYDADAMSFWASDQYRHDISLFNDPRSHLVTPRYTPEQLGKYNEMISALNQHGESDLLSLYLR